MDSNSDSDSGFGADKVLRICVPHKGTAAGQALLSDHACTLLVCLLQAPRLPTAELGSGGRIPTCTVAARYLSYIKCKVCSCKRYRRCDKSHYTRRGVSAWAHLHTTAPEQLTCQRTTYANGKCSPPGDGAATLLAWVQFGDVVATLILAWVQFGDGAATLLIA